MVLSGGMVLPGSGAPALRVAYVTSHFTSSSIGYPPTRSATILVPHYLLRLSYCVICFAYHPPQYATPVVLHYPLRLSPYTVYHADHPTLIRLPSYAICCAVSGTNVGCGGTRREMLFLLGTVPSYGLPELRYRLRAAQY